MTRESASALESLDSLGLEEKAAWLATCTADGQTIAPDEATGPARLLQAGALIAARMRCAVHRSTGYTMSAGIANSKMVAKLGSSRFKPNRQTLVPTASVQALLSPLRLQDVNGLRGKRGERGRKADNLCELVGELGEEIAQSFCGAETTLGSVVQLGLEGVAHGVGSRDTATWLLAICRGEDSSAVKPNLRPKSLNSFKSFVVHDQQELQGWLELLCGECAFARAESSTWQGVQWCQAAAFSGFREQLSPCLMCTLSVFKFCGWHLVQMCP